MAQSKELQEKLARMRAKMSKVDLGGNKGFWAPPSGNSIIRILPEVHKMEFFFQEVGKHYVPDDKEGIFCPSYTTGNEFECPICELVQALWKGGDQDRELASKLKVKRSFWMNVVVRDKEDDGGNTGNGPLIFTPGVTIFSAIQAMINGSYGDVTDIDDGVDLEIQKKGEKLNTEYQVFPRHTRKPIPLHIDDNVLGNYLEKAQDLTWVMLSEDKEEDGRLGEGHIIRLMPYDRMLEEYGIGPDTDTSKLDYDKKSQGGRNSNAGSAVRAAVQERRAAKAEEPEEEAFPVKDTDEVGNEFKRLRDRRAAR